MEGVDPELLGELFRDELDGHVCEVALAIGYPDTEKDWNYGLPKARLAKEDVIAIVSPVLARWRESKCTSPVNMINVNCQKSP